MKHTFSTLFILLVGCLLSQPLFSEDRNPISRTTPEPTLQKWIVRNQKWVDYPAYSDRAGWDSLTGDNKQWLIERGEKRLNYQWQMNVATDYLTYERTGDRQAMQSKQTANNNALSDLVLAELAEGKGRFLDQIINGVWMECERTSWVLSAHLHRQDDGRNFPNHTDQIIDLGSGEVGAFLAWTYYFLHAEMDKVNPIISQRLHEELHNRITVPYLKRQNEWWLALNRKPDEIVNNWNPWCNCNVLQVVMLTEDNDSLVNQCVWQSMRSVDQFLNYTKPDGACEEGPSYWGHAAGKLYDYLSLLYKITGGHVSLFDNAQVRAQGEYFVRAYIGNGWVVNFADATAHFDDNISTLLYRYGEAVGSQDMQQLASLLAHQRKRIITGGTDIYRSLEGLRVYPKIMAQPGRLSEQAYTWYPDTEVCIYRRGGWLLAAKGGHNNESHNHNDIGTCLLYHNQQPVLIDAGVGTYTKQTFSAERYQIWSMQSGFHNLPVLNGYEQKEGRTYHAASARTAPKRYSVTFDIASAYPQEAGVRQWNRTYTLTGKGLTIHNEGVFTALPATPVVEHLMVWGKATIKDAATIQVESQGNTYTIRHDRTDTVQIETIELNDPRMTKVWGETITRITLHQTHTTLCPKYTITIQ